DHPCPVGVGAGLRKGEPPALGDADFDTMRHRASADVVPERGDGCLAPDLAWPARRIVAVDHPRHRIVGVEAGERSAVTCLDGLLDRLGRDGRGPGGYGYGHDSLLPG